MKRRCSFRLRALFGVLIALSLCCVAAMGAGPNTIGVALIAGSEGIGNIRVNNGPLRGQKSRASQNFNLTFAQTHSRLRWRFSSVGNVKAISVTLAKDVRWGADYPIVKNIRHDRVTRFFTGKGVYICEVKGAQDPFSVEIEAYDRSDPITTPLEGEAAPVGDQIAETTINLVRQPMLGEGLSEYRGVFPPGGLPISGDIRALINSRNAYTIVFPKLGRTIHDAFTNPSAAGVVLMANQTTKTADMASIFGAERPVLTKVPPVFYTVKAFVLGGTAAPNEIPLTVQYTYR